MIDGNEHGLIARKTVLKQEGFDSVTVTSAEAGLDLLHTHRFDLVVTDYKMRGMDGIAFIAHLRERSPGTPVILLSGSDPNDYKKEALKLGATLFMQKTPTLRELELKLEVLFSQPWKKHP